LNHKEPVGFPGGCVSEDIIKVETPEEPELPLEPDVPLVPEDPLEPDVPFTPLVPEEPLLPDVPELPLEPDVPELPLEPDVPDEPATAKLATVIFLVDPPFTIGITSFELGLVTSVNWDIFWSAIII